MVEFLRVLRRRWVYVLVPLVLVVGATTYLSVTATKVYIATASVYFARPAGDSTSELLQGATYTQQQLASYATLATKPIVLDKVIDDLDLDVTARELARSVTARVSADTVIIDLRASSASPERAADVANAVAGSLDDVVQEVTPSTSDATPTVTATIVADATVPTVPASPNTRMNVLAGLVGGLMLGLLAALARDQLDTRVREVDDLPDGLPVLASIPFDRAAEQTPALVDKQGSRARAEAFRRLRTNLRFTDVDDQPVQVLAVTSPMPGEGKTSTAANLALVLADEEHRVLLIDADLRLPRAADYLGAVSDVGLADALVSRVSVEDAMQKGPSGLSFLAAGSLPPNPSELLGSRAMAELVQSLRPDFDHIVIDTPALLPVTDGSVVASLTDGAVLVAAHGASKRGDVGRAVDALHTVGARVLGVVFNRVPRSGVGESRGYGPYLQDSPSTRQPNPTTRVVGKEEKLGKHAGSTQT